MTAHEPDLHCLCGCQDGSTPLMWAIAGKHMKVSQFLLESGANASLATLVGGMRQYSVSSDVAFAG